MNSYEITDGKVFIDGKAVAEIVDPNDRIVIAGGDILPRGLRTAALMGSLMRADVPISAWDWPRVKNAPIKTITESDRARIDAAEAKRARKAAKLMREAA